MKLQTAAVIIITAFIISLGGFILSAAMPQHKFSDTLMIVALFGAAASGMLASLFTKKLVKSKQWKYLVSGAGLLLLGIVLKKAGLHFTGETVKIAGGLLAITALGFFIYKNRADFSNSKWIWFVPFILLGCLFKLLYWPGGNFIFLASLVVIVVLSVIQLTKQNTRVQLLLTAWQITSCICIAVF